MKLSEEARKMANAYQREWKRKHPEKIREYMSRYWEKKVACYTVEMKARDLHQQGFTQREIAEQLGLSLGAVNKYLNKS